MQYLYIASMTGFSGKSLIALGLGLILKEKGYKVGYIKPYGKIPLKAGGNIVDADAEFMRKTLDIQDPPEVVSPFVATFEDQTNVLKGKASSRFSDFEKAVPSIKDKDIVLVGGGADLFEGSIFGINSFSGSSIISMRRHLL